MSDYFIAPRTSFVATSDAIREKTGLQDGIVWGQDGFASTLNSLTAYANSVTGESDTNLSDAVTSLADGYGGGGNYASDSFTLENAANTITLSIPFEPTKVVCFADLTNYPTDNTWKMYIEMYLGSGNGGVRIIRYGTSNYSAAVMPDSNFSYANGVFSMKGDYKFVAGITYNWHAWQ